MLGGFEPKRKKKHGIMLNIFATDDQSACESRALSKNE